MSVAVHTAVTPREAISSSSNVDRSHQVRRLRKNALTLLAGHRDVVPLGDDNLVAAMARSEGLGADDVAILRVGVTGTRYTLVCVPHSVWHSERTKPRLIALKRRANEMRRNCVLVPASFIQREPRLSNSRAIDDAVDAEVSMENRMAILVHLIENGYSTLLDCAAVVDHPSPFSCVLNLVALGVIKMDLSRVLSPESRVEMADVV